MFICLTEYFMYIVYIIIYIKCLLKIANIYWISHQGNREQLFDY
jgi:hypothetical protein